MQQMYWTISRYCPNLATFAVSGHGSIHPGLRYPHGWKNNLTYSISFPISVMGKLIKYIFIRLLLRKYDLLGVNVIYTIYSDGIDFYQIDTIGKF